MATSYSTPKMVTDGLVFYMDSMNTKSYTSGSTIWTNLVRQNSSASLNQNVRPSATMKGNPLNTVCVNPINPIIVESTRSFAEIDFDRNNRFTMAVWASVQHISASAIGGTNQGIFARGSFGGYVGIHAFRQDSSSVTSLRVGCRDEFGQAPIVTLTSSLSTGSIENSQIFNAVLVFNSSSIIGYLDGVRIGSSSIPATTTVKFTGSYQMNSVGGIGGNTGPVASMSIYSAMMYNRALTDAEVLQNYRTFLPRIGA